MVIDRDVQQFASLKKLTPQQRMIVRLRRVGVTIEPTEDTDLYEDYRVFTSARSHLRTYSKQDHSGHFERLDRRDRFIAERIHKTLRPGELGFLFWGVNHGIQSFLETDIKLGVYLGKVTFIPRKYE